VCGGEEKCLQSFGGEIWKENTSWKSQAYMKNNIKVVLKEIGWEDVE
jgi:hypothetical protein